MSTLSSILAPFGSWSIDRDIADLQPHRCVYVTARRFVAVFQEKYVLKMIEDGVLSVEKELKMMLLAGDCSVTPLGRVFNKGKIEGILMPYETSIITRSNEPSHSPRVTSNISRTDKLKIIDQLCALVSRLHGKGIIHGDIKPSNLLLCSDDELRLCDFAEAAVKGEGYTHHAMSMKYASPGQFQ